MSKIEEYEKIINDLRMKNHENINQLIVIKSLIHKNNKELLEYVDSILKNNTCEEDELAGNVLNIPIGGLKGLIYYKLFEMKNNGIKYHIEVSKQVEKNAIINQNIEILQNYYNIVGVFIDNAIDAVKLLSNKLILMELYYNNDNNFIFSISNQYKEKIDANIFGKEKFTTKGDEHGYGLRLVKEIVKKHVEIFCETKITGNLFTQEVGIRLKNKKI